MAHLPDTIARRKAVGCHRTHQYRQVQATCYCLRREPKSKFRHYPQRQLNMYVLRSPSDKKCIAARDLITGFEPLSSHNWLYSNDLGHLLVSWPAFCVSSFRQDKRGKTHVRAKPDRGLGGNTVGYA